MPALLLTLLLLSGWVGAQGTVAPPGRLQGAGPSLTLTFALRNDTGGPQRFYVGEGTALVPAEFVVQQGLTAVFLLADLDVELQPGQSREVTLPVVPQGAPGAGYYQASYDPVYRRDADTVRKALAQARGGQVSLAHPQAIQILARYGLLAHEQPLESLRGRMQTELGPSQVDQLYRDLSLLTGQAPPPRPSPSPAAQPHLRLLGQARYESSGGRITMSLTEVYYEASPTMTSGTVKLTLWATTQGKYSGGKLTGYRLFEQSLGRLSGGTRLLDQRFTGELRRPPAGSYTIVATLEEYTEEGYRVRSWINFDNPWNF